MFALAALLGFSNGCSKKSAEKKTNGEIPKTVVTVALRVSTTDLQGLLDEKTVRILDVRDEKNYAAGHVPGAVRVDLGNWKATALENDGKGLADKAAWEKLVRAAGINNLTPVVVYSDSPTNAARIWWTLKYLGVEQAGILDGGWKSWTAAEGKTSTETATIETGDFKVEFDAKRLAVIDELKQEGTRDGLQIVDARTDGEYVAGKIGDAVHLNWTNLMAEDGKLKPTDELKKIFAASKLDAEKTAVTYCQSGGRAALNAYALEVAGFKNVKNYYCSWSQWSKQAKPKKSKKKPAPKAKP
jgi:thiosulfate/3-mercaptopyruvate sulfurtransferase